MSKTPSLDFIRKHCHHFNAMQLKLATNAWIEHIQKGGKMFLTLAGAMSSAKLGISLAPLIRAGLIHGISCTGANLEESIFRLIADSHYEIYPDYKTFSKEDDFKILKDGKRRVTDMAIPEAEAFRVLEPIILEEWKKAREEGVSYFPHEFFYNIIRSGKLKEHYDGNPEDCWLLAACEKKLPIFVPGAEDSTMGNIFASYVAKDEMVAQVMKGGIEYMKQLYKTYRELSKAPNGLGFFQIGGGISGDFPICVVPSLIHDMGEKETKPWAYFCQISDSTTSYGSYSGAPPTEKITWDKLRPETPQFVIESDATIVAPLIFTALLEVFDETPEEEGLFLGTARARGWKD
jgi:deoxyhypusine synthase